MKKDELPSVLRSLQNGKGRTSLAVAVGVLAMLLLLLSEFYPAAAHGKQRYLPFRLRLSASTRPNWSSSWKNSSASCRGGKNDGHGHLDHRGGDCLCSGHPDRRCAAAGDPCSFTGWLCAGRNYLSAAGLRGRCAVRGWGRCPRCSPHHRTAAFAAGPARKPYLCRAA